MNKILADEILEVHKYFRENTDNINYDSIELLTIAYCIRKGVIKL